MERIIIWKKDIVLYICVLLGIFTFLMTCISPASADQGALFFFYQLLGVLLPGTAFVRVLRLPVVSNVEAAAWGYGMGQVLSVVQYFLLAAAGHLDRALVLQCVISLSAAFYLLAAHVKGTIPETEKTSGKEILCIICLVMLNLSVRFFTYHCRNLLPEYGHNVVFPNQDLLFYIGNAISAGKGFPVQEFRFAGQEFRYHYFGSLMLEIASRVTGIPEFTLEFCFSWVQMPLLLILGFWCLMRRMGISGKFRVLGEFLLLFTTGWELVVYIAFQEKMYVSPFGYDVGLAFAVLTVTFLLVQGGLDKLHPGIWAAALLTFTLCTGAKAPVAVVVLILAGGICAVWMFREKRPGQAFAYGIPFVAVFVLLFFAVISEGMSTVSHNQTGLFLSFTGHLYECGLGSAYYDMVGKGMPKIPGKILIILAYFLGANPVVYGLFYPAVLCRLRRAKCPFSVEGFMVVSVVAAMLLTLFTKQSGNSQMYFAMTAVPFAIAYDMYWLTGRRRGNRGAEICFRSAAAVVLLVSVCCWFHILWVSVEDGYEKLVYRDTFEDIGNSVTWEEYEAYCWIRDHTDEDAVMLCNIAMNDHLYQSFIVGVCTKRQMWMEGWRYVAGYLDQERIDERRHLIREAYSGGRAMEVAEAAEAEYIIWIRRFNPEADLPELEDRKVYDNGSVAVYRTDLGGTDK